MKAKGVYSVIVKRSGRARVMVRASSAREAAEKVAAFGEKVERAELRSVVDDPPKPMRQTEGVGRPRGGFSARAGALTAGIIFIVGALASLVGLPMILGGASSAWLAGAMMGAPIAAGGVALLIWSLSSD